MKKVSLLAILISLWPGPGLPQSTKDLVNDRKNTDNVTTQSIGYDRKSYSPLMQINKSNVKRLVPVWSLSLMNDMGELAAPVKHASGNRIGRAACAECFHQGGADDL
jgi:alcohol dehydrogenase (cytochrome c)